MFGCWIFVCLSLGILDIALIEVSGYWILDIGSLRISVIATLKTEQYSASGAKYFASPFLFIRGSVSAAEYTFDHLCTFHIFILLMLWWNIHPLEF